jgi:dihydroorotate dehydrogenase (NAD+) catalytic subunit
MEQQVDLAVEFAGLKLANPVVTASGTCGYAEELLEFMDISQIGGVVTKSITSLPRKGNPTPRIVETDAGMLNAIGLANIGLERFILEKIPLLENLDTVILVNVAGQMIEDYVAVAERLAKEKAVAGLELNISCPNVKQGGISFGTDPVLIKQITSQVKKVCAGKPLIVKLTPTVTDICATAKAAVEAGADALSMVNTFTAMVIDIENRRPVLANRTGGLSGPAIKPIAVYLVSKVYQEVARPAGIPILGGGGICTGEDAIEFMIAGASAVTVGTATFKQPDCALRIVEGIRHYCVRKGIRSMKELTGSLRQ